MTTGRQTTNPERATASATNEELLAQARELGAEIAALVRARFASSVVAQNFVKELSEALNAGLEPSALVPRNDSESSQVAAPDVQQARVSFARDARLASAYGPGNPRTARILAVQESRELGELHLIFDVEGSGLKGRTGDRVALCPRNDPEDVRRILRAFNARGVETLTTVTSSGPAWRVLLEDVEIASIPPALREELLSRLVTRDKALLVDEFIRSANPSLLGLVRRFPSLSSQLPDIVRHLRPLAPIHGHLAQAFGVEDAELHVLISAADKARGTDSGLSLVTGTWVPVYVEAMPERHLAEQAELPLVIFADGLGLNLARSYVVERRRLGQRGRCWIIALGAERSNELLGELAQWQTEGLLTRLDLGQGSGHEPLCDLGPAQQMLWRWFVDRSAFLLVGSDSSAIAHLESLALALLSAGSTKPPEWFESPLRERRDLGLYRTIALA